MSETPQRDAAGVSLTPLVQALFGACGYSLRRAGEVVEQVEFDGPERMIRLVGGVELAVPASVAPSPAEDALKALVGECVDSHVELVLDADGLCVETVGRIEEILGVPAGHLHRAPIDGWLRRVHPFDQGALRQAVSARAAHTGVVRYRRSITGIRFLEVQLEPRGSGLIVSARDVTESHSLRAKIASAERRERALVDAQPDTLLRVRDDGRIVELRPGRSRLPEGLTPMSVGGRMSDSLRDPHGAYLERLGARVAKQNLSDRARIEIDDDYWEVRVEPADKGHVLMLVRDVTERERLLKEVVAAREVAESANRQKSRFLANMSHEIRTPLNGVLGTTDLLGHTALSEEQAELVQTLKTSGRVLLGLLNDLLDLSKIEAGQLVLESLNFDLVNLFEEALELVAPAAAAKDLVLVLDVEPTLPTVATGDPKRVRQILFNLVSNAVKFTSEGHVVVRVRQAGEARIRVEVEDTGIGIEKDAVASLFMPFHQADASISRRFGGTGLGLAICKELVEHMDGGIGVTTEPGRGSVFSFHIALKLERGRREDDRFPLADLTGRRMALHGLHPQLETSLARLLLGWGVELADEQDDPDVVLSGDAPARVISDAAHVHLVPWGVPRAGRCVRTPPRRAALLKALRDALGIQSSREARGREAPTLYGTVLVVDDNPVNQQITRAQLLRMGVSVLVAGGGEQSLGMAADADLILMDLMMPDLDGFEATRRIRERGIEVPIVALTAGLSGERGRCEDAGMNGHLTKPVDPRQLRSVLHRWLLRQEESRKSA